MKWSVRIERMSVMSSAIEAVWGSSSLSSIPLSPCVAKLNGDLSTFGVPRVKANRSPAMTSAGHGWPSSFSSSGLRSNRSSWLGAPAMWR
ncbi:MAG: hypothetical protein QM783_11820 [Phycisphaerales bacterium]